MRKGSDFKSPGYGKRQGNKSGGRTARPGGGNSLKQDMGTGKYVTRSYGKTAVDPSSGMKRTPNGRPMKKGK